MAKDFRHTSPKAHDPLEAILRYHTSSLGLDIEGEDNVIVKQRGKYKVETQLISAPWMLVLFFAVLNSIAVFWVRIVWIDTFGRPEIFGYHTELEKEYKALKKKGIENDPGHI